LLIENEPTACDPAAGATQAVPKGVPQVTPVTVVPAVMVRVPPMVAVFAFPASCTEHAVTTALEVPELVMLMVQSPVEAVHEVTCAEICAELVNDPKSPNTNPAMAMAAMSVMAMRMTVASTGEMAFLFLR